MGPPSAPRKDPRRLELLLGLGVSLLIVALDARAFTHAGGLWRDEVTSANLAGKPSLAEVWRENYRDSFPVLWGTVLHGWIHYGPGGADGSLRLLGLLVGVAAVVTYWASARSAGVHVPWVLLVVLGLNPTMIVYGGEVRGYGLGVVTELAMLAAVLLFVQRPTVARGVLAGAAALVCVQSLFANCLMLAAALIAAGLVALAQRRWKVLGVLAAIGVLAAASMLPYLRTFAKHSEWFDIVRQETGLPYLVATCADALGMSSPVVPFLWPVLLLGTLAGCLFLAGTRRPGVGAATRVLAAWCFVAMVLSLVLHFWFMKFLKVPTRIWYYLPVLALTALCMDITLERLIGENRAGRLTRVAAALVLAVLAGVSGWRETRVRLTRVDLVAAAVARQAEPRDLVVVWPWYTACVFDRYYTGSAPWIALPDFDDKKWQYYPVFREKMFRGDAVRQEIGRIESTLRGGGRVWLVGGLCGVPPGRQPIELPAGPSPTSSVPWNDLVYSIGWSQQVAVVLQAHSDITPVPVAPREPCRPEENAGLLVARNWR